MPAPRIRLHQHPWLDAVALLAAVLAAFALFRLTDHNPQHLPFRADTTRFNADSAYATTRRLAEGFGPRVTGTPSAERAAEWIRGRFDAYGLVTSIDTFSLVLHGDRVIGRDVIARSGGVASDSGAIVVLAHYDGQTTSSEAAGDDAAGVASVLELARVLELEGHRRPIVYLATDAKEWGSIGAAHFAAWPGRPHRIVAAISLDHLANGVPGKVTFDAVGQGGGYAPLWLRHAAEEAYDSVSAEAEEEPRLSEWFQRAARLSTSDQGPLVAAGIPAVNVDVEAKNEVFARFIYHTPGDRVETLDTSAFRVMGAGAERLIHALDRNPQLHGSSHYFEIEEGHVVSRVPLLFGTLLVFLPLLWATYEAWRSALSVPASRQAVRGELARAALWWVISLLGLLILRAIAHTPLLPRYELYPATVRDPFVYQVRYAPILIVVLAFAGLTALFGWLRRRLGLSQGHPLAGRAVALLTLVVIVALAETTDPFAAAMLLLVPAWLWPWVGPTARPVSRAMGTLVILVSALPFLVIPIVVGDYFQVGPKVGWYMILQAAYGAWSALAVVVFLVAVAAGWRLIGTATTSLEPAAGD